MDIKTFHNLQCEFDKVLLLKDRGILKALCATVIANRMSGNAVWLFLVAGPSSGKSEFLESLNGLEFIHPISTLTVNTFASGQRREGMETSLLYKLNNGILVFKDFTSIITKNREAMQEIMGQLREIYDGSFVKETGTGFSIKWKGRIGLIAGITSIIDNESKNFAVMGERFIQYKIINPDRVEALRRAWDNSFDIKEKREHLKLCMKSYLEHILNTVDEERIKFDDDTKNNLFEIANFITLARSGVVSDFRTGNVLFVPEYEMPMRVSQQLHGIACGLAMLNKAEPLANKTDNAILTLEDISILYKIALDSIPTPRRITLINLAKYRGGLTTAGLATKTKYPTDTVKMWLQQVNALGLCDRIKGTRDDLWKLKEEYRDTIEKFEHIHAIDGELTEDEAEKIENLAPDIKADEFDVEVALLFQQKEEEELLKKQEEIKYND